MSGSALFQIFSSTCTSVTGTDCDAGLPKSAATGANLNRLLTVTFGILGAVAVLMIVIGAFNFINSEGDPQKAERARGTIIFSLIGLVIAISAEAIVTFVLGNF